MGEDWMQLTNEKASAGTCFQLGNYLSGRMARTFPISDRPHINNSGNKRTEPGFRLIPEGIRSFAQARGVQKPLLVSFRKN